jgi:polysaccharide transporter, PST family
VQIAMGPKYMASVSVLGFLAMIPFTFAINNIYGTQGMLNFGMKAQFSRIILISAVLNNIILVPLCFWFKAPGAAASGLITQSLITVIMASVLYRRDIILLPRLSDLGELVSSLSTVAQRRFKKLTFSAGD